MSFKQAFFQCGITGFDKRLKDLNEEEEFSALINWALNKLQYFHSMDLRYRVNGSIYQTPSHKNGREIRVGKPRLKIHHPGAITYDWDEETKYTTLEVDKITASVERADIINAAKKKGILLSKQQISELARPEGPPDWDYPLQVESPQVELIQTERNCWDEVLTEEERNLLSEFWMFKYTMYALDIS